MRDMSTHVSRSGIYNDSSHMKAEGQITAEDGLDFLISTEMKRKAHERRLKARQPECSAAIQDPSRGHGVPRQSTVSES